MWWIIWILYKFLYIVLHKTKPYQLHIGKRGLTVFWFCNRKTSRIWTKIFCYIVIKFQTVWNSIRLSRRLLVQTGVKVIKCDFWVSRVSFDNINTGTNNILFYVILIGSLLCVSCLRPFQGLSFERKRSPVQYEVIIIHC